MSHPFVPAVLVLAVVVLAGDSTPRKKDDGDETNQKHVVTLRE